MNTEWIAGAVVVVGFALSMLTWIIYGVWDVVRLRRGENLSITASSWIGKFLARHPFVAVCSGVAVGIMLAHLAAWTTAVTVPGPCP